MSSLTTLARPYAKAAFELAQGEQALARWDDMLTLASRIVTDEAVADLLDNPEVSSAAAVGVIRDTAGESLNERFQGYLDVLASYGRLPLLPEITGLFRRLREDAEKRLRVRVVSAVPLDSDQADRMREALARRFDREIELENEIDESVIGGAVVYAGDQVIDGSLRGRLDKLSNSLAN
jgi:F-type H+-transporting ATPase subunit delta